MLAWNRTAVALNASVNMILACLTRIDALWVHAFVLISLVKYCGSSTYSECRCMHFLFVSKRCVSFVLLDSLTDARSPCHSRECKVWLLSRCTSNWRISGLLSTISNPNGLFTASEAETRMNSRNVRSHRTADYLIPEFTIQLLSGGLYHIFERYLIHPIRHIPNYTIK